MDKKIMLAVDEEEFNNIKELINEHICDGCEESYSGEYSRGVPCNNGEICLQNLFNGKAISDAEAEIAKIKRELADEIFAELDDSFDASFPNQRFITDDNYQQLKAKYLGEK